MTDASKRQRTSGAALAQLTPPGAEAPHAGTASDMAAFMSARGGRIQQLEAQLQEATATIQQQAQQLGDQAAEAASLRSQLSTWHAVKDAEAASLAAINARLTEQLAGEVARSHALDAQMKKLNGALTDARLQAEQLQHQLADATTAASAAKSAAAAELRNMRQQLGAAQRSLADAAAAHAQALAAEQMRVRAEQEAHLATQQDLGDVKAALASANARASEAQEAAAAAAGRAVVAETRVASMASSDDQVLLRTLQERLEQQEQQLAAARVAAAEAALLPELRAALVAARTQAAAGSNAAAALAASQRTVTELQEQLDVWRSSCRAGLGVDFASPQVLLGLRAKHEAADKAAHDARAELLAVREEAASMAAALAAAEAAAAAAGGRQAAAELELQQAEVTLRLSRTECDGLQRLVALLEQEQQGGGGGAAAAAAAAAAAGTCAGARPGSGDPNPDDAMAVDEQQHMQEADAAGSSSAAAAAKLAAAQALVQELQAARQQLAEQLAAATEAAASSNAKATTATADARAANKEAEQLALRCQALEAQLFAGEYDPSCTRVLSLGAHNPAAEVARLQAEARMDRLAAENEELKAALSRAAAAAAAAAPPTGSAVGDTGDGGGGAAPGDAHAGAAGGVGAQRAAACGGNAVQPQACDANDPTVAAAIAAAEVKLLQRRLAAADKQVAALKDVFNKRVKAFRDSVRHLFGYRLEMVSDPWPDVARAPTTYSLASVYGPKADQLMFRYHPETQPPYSLVATPLSERLSRDVRVFIGNFSSIPALTANHTMTLFQQSTQGG